MARSSIGLDIGTRAVSVAEVTGSGKPVLARFGRSLLPPGAVEHGEIVDPIAVGATITGLWKKLGLTGRAVHLGVANRHVVVRVIELPAMSKDDLGSAIRFQAQDHIPIPLDEAVMDFQIIDEVQREDGNFQRILVVAAERGTIAPLLAAVQAAKLEASTLELNAYPLVRCFGTNDGTAQAVVDIGAGVTNVIIHKDGKIRFTRILPAFGGEEFTKGVADALGVSRDEAETLKRRASSILRTRGRAAVPAQTRAHAAARRSAAAELATSEAEFAINDPGDFSNGAIPASQVEAAAAAIDPTLDRFVTEIRGSLDFYTSQPDAVQLEKIVLTGGGSLMGGIAERLSGSLGIAVDHGHPFESVPVGKIQVSPQEMAIAEPFMGVAIGLALAEVNS